MPKTRADNRTRLLQAAEKVTYHYGFDSAAIADIAKEARIPLGNVYYYFQSKDAIQEIVAGAGQSGFTQRADVRFRADQNQQPRGAGPQWLSCRDLVLRTAKVWRRGCREIEGVVRDGSGMDGDTV